MLLRPNRVDFEIIGFYMGRIAFVMAGATIFPALWAIGGREWDPFASFVLMAGVFTLFGAAGARSKPPEARLDWSHGMVVVALTWVIVPIVGAIPLALSGHFVDPLDAVFDALSGLSTTGLSVMQDLDHLAPSLNFWRHMLHFLGGQGIILAALSLFAGGGGLTLYYGEARDEKIFPSVTSTARFIWAVALVHLVFGVLLLGIVGVVAVGLDPLRSVFHGLLVFFAAFDTGGFAPQSTSLGYYHSWWYEAAASILMVAGAMSFGLHFALWRRRTREVGRNLEVRTIVATFLGTLTLTIVGLAVAGQYGGAVGLSRTAAFQVVSAHTGTGFATVPSSELLVWSGLAFGGMTIAMALGGMASSTAGGVKALRVGLTLKVLRDQVRQVLLPERSVVPRAFHHGGRRILTAPVAQAVLAVSLLYVALYLFGAGVGIAHGAPLDAALFESISAGANVGLSVGLTDASMPVVLQLTYMAQMWLGRLEFVAVFSLIGFLVAWVRGR